MYEYEGGEKQCQITSTLTKWTATVAPIAVAIMPATRRTNSGARTVASPSRKGLLFTLPLGE